MILERTKENVFDYWETHPNATMQDFYRAFGATTKNEQGSVRGMRSMWLQSKKKDKKYISDLKREKFLKKSLKEIVLEFRNFVGYVDNMGKVHEGEAFPPPIDEKGRYLGILRHELKAFVLIWLYLKTGIFFFLAISLK